MFALELYVCSASAYIYLVKKVLEITDTLLKNHSNIIRLKLNQPVDNTNESLDWQCMGEWSCIVQRTLYDSTVLFTSHIIFNICIVIYVDICMLSFQFHSTEIRIKIAVEEKKKVATAICRCGNPFHFNFSRSVNVGNGSSVLNVTFSEQSKTSRNLLKFHQFNDFKHRFVFFFHIQNNFQHLLVHNTWVIIYFDMFLFLFCFVFNWIVELKRKKIISNWYLQ